MGAAGVDRFDAFLLKQVGIDMDAMVAKANEAAQSAAGEHAEAAGQWVGEVADAANQATAEAGERCGDRRRGGRLADGGRGQGRRCGSTWSAATSGPSPALVDWPGWSRSGKDDEQAVEALLAYAPRYARGGQASPG